MRGETKERWRDLCEQVVVEQDPDRFLATIQELLRVLEENEERRRKAPELPMLPTSQNHPNLSRPVA